MMSSNDTVKIGAYLAGLTEKTQDGYIRAFHPALGFFAYCDNLDQVGDRMGKLSSFYMKMMMKRGGVPRLRTVFNKAGVKYDLAVGTKGRTWEAVSEAERVYA